MLLYANNFSVICRIHHSNMFKAENKIKVFKEYLGQQVWIRNLYKNGDEPEHRFGTLSGIQQTAILITFLDQKGVWFNLFDLNSSYEFKLLLQPCSRLQPEIIEEAKALPVSSFIIPFYRSRGFDLPVFISPGHPANCKNVIDIELADYRKPEEITSPQCHISRNNPAYASITRTMSIIANKKI